MSSQQNRIHRSLLFLTVGLLPMFCSACGTLLFAPQEIDLTAEFSADPERERLRWFREIGAANLDPSLTGDGVRITVMGEMVDVSHPDLTHAIHGQYNTYSKKEAVLRGSDNWAYRHELFGRGDGHGTHIAGTIAAACDQAGIQGLACKASLDVYDLGAYDNSEKIGVEGWGDTHEFDRFLEAFVAAVRDVTRRGASRITTGSFNLESPAIRFERVESNLTTKNVLRRLEEGRVNKPEDLVNLDWIRFQNPEDATFLVRVADNNDDPTIAMMALFPLTTTWQRLEEAIHDYQQADGVYIVTESNYTFENQSSTLNALPSLSDLVDEELWISVVMAVPADLDPSAADSAEEVEEMLASPYVTPLNSCGELAKDYCILTPSYHVMSTMTHQVAGEGPILTVDGRPHEVYSGHSMGAPMVAATLALMEQHNQEQGLGLSMRDLVRLLKQSANRDFEGYDPIKHGRGMLNVEGALAAMPRATHGAQARVRSNPGQIQHRGLGRRDMRTRLQY